MYCKITPAQYIAHEMYHTLSKSINYKKFFLSVFTKHLSIKKVIFSLKLNKKLVNILLYLTIIVLIKIILRKCF